MGIGVNAPLSVLCDKGVPRQEDGAVLGKAVSAAVKVGDVTPDLQALSEPEVAQGRPGEI